MRITSLPTFLLVFVLLIGGCDQIQNRPSTPRYNPYIELLAAKYEIYKELEAGNSGPCRIEFIAAENDPGAITAQLGSPGTISSREEDAAQFQDMIEQIEQRNAASPSSSVFDEPASEEPEASSSITTPGSADAIEEAGLASHTVEDNEFYTLRTFNEQPALFSQIELSSPDASAARLTIPTLANLIVKSGSSNVEHDSLEAQVVYSLTKNVNGQWICADANVNLLKQPERPEPAPSGPSGVPGW